MKDKEKYIKGKWYKDKDGDFIKFSEFDEYGDVEFTACVQYDEYASRSCGWDRDAFPECTPMTIEEMKEHLPEHEWWSENSNEMFPIY